MRKTILAAAFAGAALILAGCSGEAENGAGASGGSGAADTATTAAAAENGAAAVSAAASAPLDPNRANAEQLGRLDGVTPALAETIVAGRPYSDVTAFNARLRRTLSEEAAAALRADIFVPVNLNTASREEIELIPGMTPRMVGEFLEYRPYEDMNEFDREIGKYVDEPELARLRRYVTL